MIRLKISHSLNTSAPQCGLYKRNQKLGFAIQRLNSIKSLWHDQTDQSKNPEPVALYGCE